MQGPAISNKASHIHFTCFFGSLDSMKITLVTAFLHHRNGIRRGIIARNATHFQIVAATDIYISVIKAGFDTSILVTQKTRNTADNC